MNNSEETLLIEIESYYPSDWSEYYESSERVRLIKNEMDQLAKQLLIAAKAGSFDNFYERVSPEIKLKLSLKKGDLINAIEKEKYLNRKKKRDYDIISENNFKKLLNDKIKIISKNSLAYSDLNLYITVLVGFILIGIQIFFNLSFESRIKSSIEEAMLEPIEAKVRLAEEKNKYLNKNVEDMQKQIAILLKPKIKKNSLVSKNIKSVNRQVNPKPRKPASN